MTVNLLGNISFQKKKRINMSGDIKLTGRKMSDIFPENFIDRIKESFPDFGLDYEKDLMNCCVLYNPTAGTCFLKHGNVNEFKKGTLIACFNKNGTGFYYTHYSRISDNNKLIAEGKQSMLNKKPHRQGRDVL